jgi:hypothetical protein
MAVAFAFGTVIVFGTITGLYDLVLKYPLLLITCPFAGTALLFILFITLLISLFISASLIGVFLFLRFILHLRSQPTVGDGVQGWAQETKGRFLPSIPITKESSRGNDSYEKVSTQ